jgi:hypothetical protein
MSGPLVAFRDKMAMRAMQAMIASSDDLWPFDLDFSEGDDNDTALRQACRIAWYIADAMLKERD